MKKFIYIFLIVLSLLSISSCCFASVDWSINDLEKFLSCYDYDFDFSEANYEGSYSYSNLINHLSSSNYPLIIFDMRNGGKIYKPNGSDEKYPDLDIDFMIFNAYTTSATNRCLRYMDMSTYHMYMFNYSSYGFAVSLSSNTVYSGGYYYTNDNWVLENLNVSEEEFLSAEFQEYLIKRFGLIYTETTIYDSDKKTPLIIPEGGKIINSSYGDTVYKGSISYFATTEKASIKYTSGFGSDTEYDLFLEIYRLDDTYDTGITGYPVDTLNCGKVTTSSTSVDVDIKKTLSSSFYVYRLCVGVNNFDISGTNTVYLCTDWLLPNDNTVRRFKSFSRVHLMDFLSFIAFDYNYDYDSEESTDNPNNPDSGYFMDINEKVLYFYDGNCLEGYISTPDNVYVRVKRQDTSVDINNCYLILDKYSYPEGEKLDSYTINLSGDSNLWSNSGEDDLIFSVTISDYYKFSSSDECYYFLRLHSIKTGYLDATTAFWFNSDYFVTDNNNDGIVGKFLEGIKNLFIPSDEFFENYFDSLHLFLKSRLGFLWDCVEFFPALFTNIQEIVDGMAQNTSFEIPELSVPTFDGKGSEVVVLESFSWSPYEYFSENSTFIDFYALYLNLIDFLVYWALVSFALDVLANILGFANAPEPEHNPIGFKTD